MDWVRRLGNRAHIAPAADFLAGTRFDRNGVVDLGLVEVRLELDAITAVDAGEGLISVGDTDARALERAAEEADDLRCLDDRSPLLQAGGHRPRTIGASRDSRVRPERITTTPNRQPFIVIFAWHSCASRAPATA
jgi:hypothetical protein